MSNGQIPFCSPLWIGNFFLSSFVQAIRAANKRHSHLGSIPHGEMKLHTGIPGLSHQYSGNRLISGSSTRLPNACRSREVAIQLQRLFCSGNPVLMTPWWSQMGWWSPKQLTSTTLCCVQVSKVLALFPVVVVHTPSKLLDILMNKDAYSVNTLTVVYVCMPKGEGSP